jgi:signal peptidase I
VALWVLFSMYIAVPVLRTGTFLLLAILYGWLIFDAVRSARHARKSYQPRRYNRAWIYTGVVVLFAFILQPLFFSGVRNYLARAYSFPSGMMSPTLLAGDYFYVIPRPPSSIGRGDLVVWRDTGGTEYVQRVVALPGDTVQMRSKAMYVNRRALREPYVQHIDPEGNPRDSLMLWQRKHVLHSRAEVYEPSRDTWGPLAVPAGNYLLLGDNRDNSYDGRYRGFVAHPEIVGRAVWVYWSRDPERGQVRWSRIGRDVE